MNKSGHVRIKPQFGGEKAGDFDEEIISAFDVWTFHDGISPIGIAGREGYIDTAGKVIALEGGQ